MTGADDEIARVAQDHADRHGAEAMTMIEHKIRQSAESQDWVALTKWSRVKLRLMRMSRADVSSLKVGRAIGSPRPTAPFDTTPIRRASSP